MIRTIIAIKLLGVEGKISGEQTFNRNQNRAMRNSPDIETK